EERRLGRRRADVQALSRLEREAHAELHAPAIVALDADATEELLRAREIEGVPAGAIVERAPVHHGERVAEEADRAGEPCAEIGLAALERERAGRAFEEPSDAGALPELEAEGDVGETDGDHRERRRALACGGNEERALRATHADERPARRARVDL